MDTVSRHNNFDILRLIAALAVVSVHITQHKLVDVPTLTSMSEAFWAAFPGVPVFFIISGFLITNSWLARGRWAPYMKARALRIFPALVLSTLVTLGILWVLGFTAEAKCSQILHWFFGQITLIQPNYVPSPFRPFSGDMPNGSIWTLPVEFQFYLLAPLLGAGLIAPRRWGTAALLLLAGFSFLLVSFDDFQLYKSGPVDIRHTVIHHFWWFGLGMAARHWWPQLAGAVKGRAVLWLFIHAAVLGFTQLFPERVGFLIQAVSLAGLVLALAFTRPGLAKTWLRGQDFSYGIYLFHRPWIHALTHLGIVGLPGFSVLLILTGGAAAVSWYLVEKPAIRVARKSSKAV